MKLLRSIRHPQTAVLVFLSFLFFLLRFPSLFEPYWYGDEGIYFVIGDGLRQGRILYEGIWDNKPPLLYLFYQFFGQSLFGIKAVSLIFGIGAIIAFYFLSLKILGVKKYAFFASLVFLFFLGTPIIEGTIANAENFMLFPILLGFIFFLRVFQLEDNISKKSQTLTVNRSLFLSGLFFGIAFLFKIVGIFDFLSLLFFFFLYIQQKANTNFFVSLVSLAQKKGLPLILLTSGFIVPITLYSLFSIFNGTFVSFLTGAYLDNISYVEWRNTFFIPHGLILLKAAILFAFLYLLFRLRNRFPVPLLFVFSYVGFSIFNIFFSQRPYGHYVLLLLPSLILLFFSCFVYPKFRRITSLSTFFIIILILYSFQFFLASRLFNYYGNFLAFVLGNKSTSSYISSFDYRTERDYALASYILGHTGSKDTIFLWGESAQIYFLTGKLPAGRYVVSYHINSEDAEKETLLALSESPPHLIIIFPDTPTPPFSLRGYNYVMTIEGASIYERSN